MQETSKSEFCEVMEDEMEALWMDGIMWRVVRTEDDVRMLVFILWNILMRFEQEWDTLQLLWTSLITMQYDECCNAHLLLNDRNVCQSNHTFAMKILKTKLWHVSVVVSNTVSSQRFCLNHFVPNLYEFMNLRTIVNERREVIIHLLIFITVRWSRNWSGLR